MLKASILNTLGGINHGFFCRKNGYSSGFYASLNCGLGSGDNEEIVVRNRNFCAGQLGVKTDHLLTVNQQHTTKVVKVKQPWSAVEAPVADALVTTQPGIVLGILTADCAPVLLSDSGSGVIGAVHAGWRGALNGVIEATVKAMTELKANPERIQAAVGPCIGFNSYEVGPEFKERLVQKDLTNSSFFREAHTTGHSYFNLSSYVAERLYSTGISQIETLSVDTYDDEDRFFSYRRTCHRKDPAYGRQLSGIALVD